jgi:hypothetical protein
MPQFVLRFPIEQVREYASRYAYAEDDEVIAIGHAARGRGYYTRDEFIKVCRWKTPRSSSRVAMNSAETVHEATRIALAGATSERGRMDALRSLHGVQWPTASVRYGKAPKGMVEPISAASQLEATPRPHGAAGDARDQADPAGES